MKNKRSSNVLIFIVLVILVCSLSYYFFQRFKSSRDISFLQIQNCNLILLTIDALRADHLTCYGYKRDVAPNICEASRKGILFENAISQSSWTKPSMGSLFTSLYPHSHKAIGQHDVLPLEVLTLAEILKYNGYYTIGFQTNPFIREIHNFDQGFDDYLTYHHFTRAEVLISEFISRINLNEVPKFFAYFHFMDLHLPYNPPKEYRLKSEANYNGILAEDSFDQLWPVREGELKLREEDKQHIISLYDGEINYVDSQIKRLLDFLKEIQISDNTIIVILSDHGEEFWDHDGFEHGHTMYNELLHVPLIILHPRLTTTNFRIQGLIRLIDIFPTLMSVLRISIPSRVIGRNLLEEIFIRKQNLKLIGFSESTLYGQEQKAVQTNSYKLIKRLKDSSTEFFDLSVDPHEKFNNFNNEQLKPIIEQYEKLLQIFSQYNSITDYLSKKKEFDEKTLEELKALGYIR